MTTAVWLAERVSIGAVRRSAALGMVICVSGAQGCISPDSYLRLPQSPGQPARELDRLEAMELRKPSAPANDEPLTPGLLDINIVPLLVPVRSP